MNGLTGSSTLERILAPAKVNLTLRILARRPDGYHELESLMQTVSLFDEINLRWEAAGLPCRTRPDLGIPEKENLAVRVAAAFFRTIGEKPHLAMEISKGIPAAAGLGGGSANAAAVLRALNRRYGHPLDAAALSALGASLGSDIPFALIGGTAIIRGRGERVEPLPSSPPLYLVLAKNEATLSTKDVYQALQPGEIPSPGSLEEVLEALRREDPIALAEAWRNGLAAPARRLMPSITLVEETLLRWGALGALLSGSGPTVMGLASGPEESAEIAARLQRQGLWAVAVRSYEPPGRGRGA